MSARWRLGAQYTAQIMLWLGWRLPLRGYQQRAAGLRCTAKPLLWLRQQRCAHAPPTFTSGASLIPDSIVAVLREGGAVVYPTSTLPGLGCLPHAAALDRLFALKKRKEQMVVSLGVASLQQAAELVHVPRGAAEMLGAFPAGSLTLILRARTPLDPRLGGEAVAVRVFGPDSALARCLVEKMGPITATSANISGVDSATDCASAGESLGLPPSAILLGPCGESGTPTTVVRWEPQAATNAAGNDGDRGTWRVVREGMVSTAALARHQSRSTRRGQTS